MSSMLDAPPQGSGVAPLAATLGTVGVHGLLALGASLLGLSGVAELRKALPVTEMVEVELPAAPAPAPTPPAAPPERAAPTHHAKPTPAAAEPPPSAAQAGKVLDSSQDVVDFGDSFVTGTGDSFAGGVTDTAGTSTTAVRDTTARGDSGGVKPAPVPSSPPVDLSRPPKLAGGVSWQCPFPAEADDAAIDHAVVTLRVEVRADGSVQSVTTTVDPGNGFGREARRCAGSKRWVSGLDRAGIPQGASATVNVRFDR